MERALRAVEAELDPWWGLAVCGAILLLVVMLGALFDPTFKPHAWDYDRRDRRRQRMRHVGESVLVAGILAALGVGLLLGVRWGVSLLDPAPIVARTLVWVPHLGVLLLAAISAFAMGLAARMLRPLGRLRNRVRQFYWMSPLGRAAEARRSRDRERKERERAEGERARQASCSHVWKTSSWYSSCDDEESHTTWCPKCRLVQSHSHATGIVRRCDGE